ncbi:hypothetical protein MPC4_320025 [Methylocella tundrae]|uniref:Uncharacterized protein n=1 Tax=Methylocella tundrae TaxID=227605 RepID=A0A8B6M830_METTU|nr:hypothetical protein MPC1_8570003 [Methylocella tundrae]VTZ51193.1 hypothetical protein MPC4_320025 [Methylocella tundrae]
MVIDAETPFPGDGSDSSSCFYHYIFLSKYHLYNCFPVRRARASLGRRASRRFCLKTSI